jgi:hypothetical protein
MSLDQTKVISGLMSARPVLSVEMTSSNRSISSCDCFNACLLSALPMVVNVK